MPLDTHEADPDGRLPFTDADHLAVTEYQPRMALMGGYVETEAMPTDEGVVETGFVGAPGSHRAGWMFWRAAAGLHLVALDPQSGHQTEKAVGSDLAEMLGTVLVGWRKDAGAGAGEVRPAGAGELSEWLV